MSSMLIVSLSLFLFYRIILSKFDTHFHVNKITEYVQHVDFTIMQYAMPLFLLR